MSDFNLFFLVTNDRQLFYLHLKSQSSRLIYQRLPLGKRRVIICTSLNDVRLSFLAMNFLRWRTVACAEQRIHLRFRPRSLLLLHSKQMLTCRRKKRRRCNKNLVIRMKMVAHSSVCMLIQVLTFQFLRLSSIQHLCFLNDSLIQLLTVEAAILK